MTEQTDYELLKEAAKVILNSPIAAEILRETAREKRLAAPAAADVSAATAQLALAPATRAAANSIIPKEAPWSGVEFISDLYTLLRAMAANRIGDEAPADVQEGETWVKTDTSGWTLSWRNNGSDIPLFTVSNTGALALSNYLKATDAEAMAGSGNGLLTASQLKSAMGQFGQFGYSRYYNNQSDADILNTTFKNGTYFVEYNATQLTDNPFPDFSFMLAVINTSSEEYVCQMATRWSPLSGGWDMLVKVRYRVAGVWEDWTNYTPLLNRNVIMQQVTSMDMREQQNAVYAFGPQTPGTKPSNNYGILFQYRYEGSDPWQVALYADGRLFIRAWSTNSGTWQGWSEIGHYDNATTTTAGLMSAADKTKLNGLGGLATPNYNSRQELYSGTADTIVNVPSDGFIQVFVSNASSLVTININSSVIHNISGINVTSPLFPVKSGDVIGTLSAGISKEISFFPVRN